MRRLLACVALFALAGCESYEYRPLPGPTELPKQSYYNPNQRLESRVRAIEQYQREQADYNYFRQQFPNSPMRQFDVPPTPPY